MPVVLEMVQICHTNLLVLFVPMLLRKMKSACLDYDVVVVWKVMMQSATTMKMPYS